MTCASDVLRRPKLPKTSAVKKPLSEKPVEARKATMHPPIKKITMHTPEAASHRVLSRIRRRTRKRGDASTTRDSASAHVAKVAADMVVDVLGLRHATKHGFDRPSAVEEVERSD